MSSPIKLNEIEIRSFRGIKNYKLETNNKSLVFCGANGTGKSSFVNALEFLFTGKVKSLSGIGGLNHDQSIIHIGDDENDVLVKARIKKHHIQRTLKDGLECDPELEDLVKDFENGSFLLNRQKLLDFINARPRNRWEEAANLINFNQYDETETAFEKCLKSFKDMLKAKEDELEKNASQIEEKFELETIYETINEGLRENNIEEITEDTDLDEFLKENSIKDELDLSELNISNVNDKYQTQLNIFDRIALSNLKSTNRLLSIISNSKSYIQEEDISACPVCGNNFDQIETLKHLKSKQDELETDNEKLKNWQRENQRLIGQIRLLNNKINNSKLNDLADDLEKLSELEITANDMDREALTDLENELASLEANSKNLSEIFDAILLLSKRKKIEKELKIVERQKEVAEISSKLFSQKKKEAIESQFEKIVERIAEYYNFIHEDDELINPDVKVKNSKGLILELIFGNGKGSDPRSYASEGHLDSLGLCIFLAFAKIYNKYDFLVLDDIISTVDLDHKEMVIRLLFEKFEGYTFIITTHNKLWYEQLRRLASANNLTNDFTFMEIIDWDKIEGPILSKNPSSKKRIEEHLLANDTFAAGNAIRRHLEFLLDDLCKRNNIPLPLKKLYTVNDYYGPVKSYFLEDVFKETNVEDYYKNVFQELDNTTYMGNLTSHNNEANYLLVKSEIEKFKNAVFGLEAAFKCTTHESQYLNLDKKRRIGICSNEKCKDIFEYEKIMQD